MSNHTPGPWKVASVFVNNAPNEIHVTTGKWGKPSVAVTGTEEDARLIAAAPELLEALKALFENCAMIHKHWGDNSNSKQANDAIAAARAAIAKAEGE